MTLDPGVIDAVSAAIDRDELVKLVLDLCNIPAPVGRGAESGQFVFDWMAREGFAPRKASLIPKPAVKKAGPKAQPKEPGKEPAKATALTAKKAAPKKAAAAPPPK